MVISINDLGDHIHNKQGCPKCSKSGYSKMSIRFLNDLANELKVRIKYAENYGEHIINDPDLKCYYKCDSYYEKNNKKNMAEFHGDYWHGNPTI